MRLSIPSPAPGLPLVASALVGALLVGCASPTRADGWAGASQGVRSGLEASQLRLEGEVLAAFPASSDASLELRRDLEAQLRSAYTPVLSAWSAFGDYAADAEIALAEDGMRGAQRIRDAFHALHVELLESRIANDFGVDAASHQSVVAGIGAAGSVATAFALAHPVVEHLSGAVHDAAGNLPANLEAIEKRAQRLLRDQNQNLLTVREGVLAEEARLADLMRRRAAGVGEVEGDPGKDLRALRVELDEIDADWKDFEARRDALAAAFRDARADATDAVQGFLAWGSAHGRVADALQSGRAEADFSLLQAVAEDLAD